MPGQLRRLRLRPLRRITRGDRGQTTVLLAVAVVLAGLMGIALIRLGGGAVARAQAHAAADAAALAGAADGRSAAQAVAADNHGTLERFEVIGSDVVVTVRVASERADARSRAGPAEPPGPHPAAQTSPP